MSKKGVKNVSKKGAQKKKIEKGEINYVTVFCVLIIVSVFALFFSLGGIIPYSAGIITFLLCLICAFISWFANTSLKEEK